MNYEIKLLREAERHYKLLTPRMRDRVDEAFAELEDNPFPRGDQKIEQLVANRGDYRSRLGQYRIVYDVNIEDQICIIRGIYPRGGAYKR